jgi:hypothetical protein
VRDLRRGPATRGAPFLLASAGFLWAAAALAQKTDIVALLSGDRLTGEIKSYDQGAPHARRVAAGVGGDRNLIQTNQTQLTALAAILVNHEQPVEGEDKYNAEATVGGRYSYFLYDFPNLTISLAVQVYPSLTEGGRVRLEASASARREIVSDLYLALSLFDSFDSRDPSTGASWNDWGPTVSVGWQF